jgi:hypothetical protein
MKVKSVTLEEAENLISRTLHNYGNFCSTTGLMDYIRLKYTGVPKDPFLSLKERIKDIGGFFSVLADVKVKKEYMSRRIYEVNMKILPILKRLLEEALEKRSVDGELFKRYRAAMKVFAANSRAMGQLLTMAAITMIREMGKDEALKYVKRKSKELGRVVIVGASGLTLYEFKGNVKKLNELEASTYKLFLKAEKELEKIVAEYEK